MRSSGWRWSDRLVIALALAAAACDGSGASPVGPDAAPLADGGGAVDSPTPDADPGPDGVPGFAVDVTVAGAGHVASVPPGIDCGGVCTASFAPGAMVWLVAHPGVGVTFLGWSGACTGTDACALTMDSDKAISAAFTESENLAVTKVGTGLGLVTSDPALIDCGPTCEGELGVGTVVTLTATPYGASVFDGWSGDCSGPGACVVTMNGPKTVTASFTATGAYRWGRSFGLPDKAGGGALAFDDAGNLFVGGTAEGTVDLGGGPTSGDWSDAFVAKYDPTGALVWATRFGTGTGWEAVGDLALTPEGDVVVAGVFQGTVDLGAGPVTALAYRDMFVARFSGSDGTYMWSRTMSGTGDDYAQDVAVDGSGGVYVTGTARGVVDLGDGIPVYATLFLARYAASDGAHVWSRVFGDGMTSGGEGYGVGVSGTSVVISGTWGGVGDLGGPPLSTTAMSPFLARYAAADGAHLASSVASCSGTSTAYALAMGPSGAVALTGNFRGTCDFGSGPLTSAGDADLFVAGYDAAGVSTWAQRFGSFADEYAENVAIGPDGVVHVAGGFWGSVDFGGTTLDSAGAVDMVALRLDGTTGTVTSAERFGGSGWDLFAAVAAGPGGLRAFGGDTQGPGGADFGGGPLAPMEGGYGFFVVLGP